LLHALSPKLGFPQYHAKWIQEEVFCREPNEQCQTALCSECSQGNSFFFKYPLIQEDEPSTITVSLWEKDNRGFLVRREDSITYDKASEML
jgi:hypothetical protein